MITRRGFLSALCAIPFVGRFLPKDPLVAASYAGVVANVAAPSENSILITSGGEAYWMTAPCGNDLDGDCACEWHQDYRWMVGDQWPADVRLARPLV
jgi:hypothetical protein